METIIREIPVTEIQVGDQIFGSSGAVSTTDKGYWLPVTKVDFVTFTSGSLSKTYVDVVIRNEYVRDYPIDGFVFVKKAQWTRR